MLNIAEILKGVDITKISVKRKRSDIVKQFVEHLHNDTDQSNLAEKIKADRFGGTPFTYKKVSPRFVAIRMAHLNEAELEWFLGACKESKNFSRYWWWALNTKKHGGDRQ